jgi:hypothetical protein
MLVRMRSQDSNEDTWINLTVASVVILSELDIPMKKHVFYVRLVEEVTHVTFAAERFGVYTIPLPKEGITI